MSKSCKVRLEVDNYVGIFKKLGRNGRGWVKFDRVGNAGVALDVAALLRKLGHEVEIVDLSEDEEAARPDKTS